MRIIAGRFRSRKLLSPKDALTTRPIPDRVKESVFNLLRGHFENASVLDTFSGTGSIGLEAVSRGASRVVLVERDRRAADLLERNIEMLGCGDEAELLRADALGPATLARCPKPVDLIFMDPPYPLVLDPDGWARVRRQLSRLISLNLSEKGFAVLRTPWPFRHVTVIDAEGHVVPAGDPRNPFDYRGRLRKDLPPPSGRRYKGRREIIDREDRGGGEARWEGDAVDVEAIIEETRRLEANDEHERDFERDIDLDAEHDHPDDHADADPRGLDEARAGDERRAAGVPGGFRLERHDVDLSIEGARGPETHEYASQAVHLYMKA
jgi:16S rRNA G966 N2-methylase RsmD